MAVLFDGRCGARQINPDVHYDGGTPAGQSGAPLGTVTAAVQPCNDVVGGPIVIRRIVGWILVAIGIICLGAQVDDVRNGKTNDLGIGVVMITVMLGGGVLLLRSASRSPLTVRVAAPGMAAQEVPLETTVLRLAKQLQGRVTPVEIATEAGIGLDVAKTELERLMKAGACTLEVSESGMLLYRFAEFEDAHAKEELI
jgi:hypothetical protein